MTQRDLERRLREYYAAKSPLADTAPADLRAAVLNVPDAGVAPLGERTNRQLVVLLVAALLAALLVGAAIAIGSGLVRLPWLSERDGGGVLPASLFLPPDCNPVLDDGLLLDAGELLLYEDGTLIRVQGRNTQAETAHWSQARLTPAGANDLLAAIGDSGIGNCAAIASDETSMSVSARLDGSVFSFDVGSTGFRLPTAGETSAAKALVRRLRTDDLGLSPHAWVSPWKPYAHDRWSVVVDRSAGVFPDMLRPAWQAADFPGDATIFTFGAAVRVDPPSSNVEERRCGLLNANELRDLLESLGEPVADRLPDEWEREDETHQVMLGARYLLPHQSGCHEDVTATPSPSIPPATADPTVSRDVCRYLPPDLATTAGGYLAGEGRKRSVGDWLVCDYGGYNVLELYASSHSVSGANLMNLVSAQLGAGVRTVTLDGGNAYLNDECFTPADVCQPAIAISAPPHFILLWWEMAGDEQLVRLAQVVLDHVDDVPAP